MGNREILSCALEDIWNQGKHELIERYYHANFVAHIGDESQWAHGIQGVSDMLAELKIAFPQFHEVCHSLIGEGDQIAARLTLSGVQEKPYWGHASNGGQFEVDSIDIYRFADNKIIEQWGIFDIVAMATQLGWDKSLL